MENQYLGLEELSLFSSIEILGFKYYESRVQEKTIFVMNPVIVKIVPTNLQLLNVESKQLIKSVEFGDITRVCIFKMNKYNCVDFIVGR